MTPENPILVDLRDYCDAADLNSKDISPSKFQHSVLPSYGINRVDCPLGRISGVVVVRPRVVILKGQGELKGEVGCNGCLLSKSGFSKPLILKNE